MRRLIGWIFILFAIFTLIGGFTDPELGIEAGLFGCIFWGLIGQYLIRKKKMKAPKPAKKQTAPAQVEAAAPMPEMANEDLEESLEFIEPVRTIRFACKSCGAKNEINSSAGAIRCEYCDSPSVPPLPSV